MSITQQVRDFENESYQQYERTTEQSLPRLGNGQYDTANNRHIFQNSGVDAFRHAYVSGRLNQIYDENFVEALGYGVEIVRRNNPDERNMDLWNNSVGRELGNHSVSAIELGDLVKDALDRGALIENPNDPRQLPNSDKLIDNLKDLLGSLSAFGVQSFIDFMQDFLVDLSTIGNFISDPIQDLLHNLTAAEAVTPAIRRYDPLALDLNHNGTIDLVSLHDSNAFFDITGNGLQNKVGWIQSGDGLLVLDSNSNGVVDNIDELFGYAEENGNRVTGTDELATYDSNLDGKIDRNDSVFSQLKVWQDADGDGETDSGELTSLVNHNITAINFSTI